MLLCWKRLQGLGRLPPASCHCMSLLISHLGPGTCESCHVRSSGSLCSEKKSFQGFKLEKTPKRKHLHFPFSGQPRKWWPHAHLRPRKCCWVWEVGPGPARHTAAKAPGLFLLLFLRPAGGCRDRLCSPLRGLFSVLFLFCKPLGFLPCTLPEHTLHLASRGSCAGICEESALWCLTVLAGAAPPPACPSPPGQHARPALHSSSSPFPSSLEQQGASEPALSPLLWGPHITWGKGQGLAQTSAVPAGRGVLGWGPAAPSGGKTHLEAGGPTLRRPGPIPHMQEGT